MGFSSFLIPVSDAGWLRVAQFVAIECKNVKVDENFVVKSWDWRESREVECKRAFCFMSFPECHRSHVSASPLGLILYYLIISLGSIRNDWWFSRKIYKKKFRFAKSLNNFGLIYFAFFYVSISFQVILDFHVEKNYQLVVTNVVSCGTQVALVTRVWLKIIIV